MNVQEVNAKLLYTFEGEKSQQFVAKPNHPLRVTIHDHQLGTINLGDCLHGLMSNCAELTENDNDFSVFSVDFSEQTTPWLAHGKLSHLTLMAETGKGGPVITGKLVSNLLNQLQFEVHLNFKSNPKRLLQYPRSSDDQELSSGALPSDMIVPPSSPPSHGRVASRFNTAPAFCRPDILHAVKMGLPLRPRPAMKAPELRQKNNEFEHQNGPMVRSTFQRKEPYGGRLYKLRKERDGKDTMKCNTCGVLRTTVWRVHENKSYCNPCGIWMKKNKSERPENLWLAKKRKHPDLWGLEQFDEPAHLPAQQQHEYDCSQQQYTQPMQGHLDRSYHAMSTGADTFDGNSTPASGETDQDSPNTPSASSSSPRENSNSAPQTPPARNKREISEKSVPVTPEAKRACPSTPLDASVDNKENLPPDLAILFTPKSKDAQEDARGIESTRRFLARYIHSRTEDDIFDQFMQSPSKIAIRQMEGELDIEYGDASSVIPSSPPTSSTNFFDDVQSDFGFDATWLLKEGSSPLKRVAN